MKLLQLSPADLRNHLAGSGVWLRTGPFSLRIRSRVPSVAEGLADLYGQFEVRHPRETFADFHVSVNPPNLLRRWLRPQVNFSLDGALPFKPLPLDQAYPMLEWGLNWCVSMHAHHYLIIHAAVVERNGLAAILPAPPGSGMIHALPRPVSLKNQSIDVIRQFAPDAFINRASHDTAKGTVAHMRPPKDSVQRQHEPARPAWVVFPKWEADADTLMTPRSKAETFMFLAQNAFNYSHLGADGFRVGTALIEQAGCYDFRYSRLKEAVSAFDHLADSGPSA
jgi:hypothetical protein